MTIRIAVAGFQHETNTFAPSVADLAAFEMADSWPPLLLGTDVTSRTRGMNLPIAGAIAAAETAEVDVVPLLWCAAEPSGPVTDAAFAQISGMILDRLAKAGPVDALYMDLHGAMVTATHPDGEGALLRLIRQRFGNDLPIGISLDLHANVTAQMVSLADVITIYRTYPHLDMAATGARCLKRLISVSAGQTLHPAVRHAPFLVPLHAQDTGSAPCKELYRAIAEAETESGYTEMAMGFTAADMPECGPAVVAYADTAEQAEMAAEAALDWLCAAESRFDVTALDPHAAVAQAALHSGAGPVILADIQDNPGAGATSDTTDLLHAMVDAGARRAALGVLWDPKTAADAHRQGRGARFDATLGAASGTGGTGPLIGPVRVLGLSDGAIAYSGAMYGGGVAEIGPTCHLLVEQNAAEIHVIVSSVRTQCLDLAFFIAFGLDPQDLSLIGVKSTTHFRAAFAPIARAIYCVAAPGAFPCDLAAMPYRRLRPGVRRGPCGPVF